MHKAHNVAMAMSSECEIIDTPMRICCWGDSVAILCDNRTMHALDGHAVLFSQVEID